MTYIYCRVYVIWEFCDGSCVYYFYELYKKLSIDYVYTIVLIYMGKFTKMEKHRRARDKARRDAPFREMEEVSRDKNMSDNALIHNYTRILTLAIRQNKYSEALKYADILANYYRTYDMHSRLLSLKNQMTKLEWCLARQTQGRIADKIRAKAGPKHSEEVEVDDRA